MPRRGRLLALTIGAVLALPAAAFAQRPKITIATILAQAGDEVIVPVSLDLGEAPFVRGIRNDIFWGPLTPVLELSNGEPDCAPNADLVSTVQVRGNFRCLEASTEDECVRLRGQVISELVPFALPSGMIYECLFRIDPAAAPGTYPLRMNRVSPGAVPLAFWVDAEGQEQMADGVAGAIIVVAPTATATETSTVTPTDTETPTVTQTPTPSTPTPTPTATRTPVVLIRALAGEARPGLPAAIGFDLMDRTGSASDLGFDLLLENVVFAVEQINEDCTLDARLDHHILTISLPGEPAPQGLRRARIALFDPDVPPDAIGDGPVMSCALPVRKDAPLGTSTVRLERAFAGNADGLIGGVQARGASLVIDPDAELPTATPSFSVTATASPTSNASSTPTSTPTRRPASPTPTPSPTPTRSCAGDCDGNASVDVAEAIRAVNIALGVARMETCAAVDGNHDDAAGVDELVAIVDHVLHGCPPSAVEEPHPMLRRAQHERISPPISKGFPLTLSQSKGVRRVRDGE